MEKRQRELGSLILLLVLTASVVDCQNSDFYSPREEYSCRAERSCSEREGDEGTNLVCRCDSQCGTFGDCCEGTTSPGEESPLAGLLECRSVHLDERTLPGWEESVWMVSACPVDWMAGRSDQLLLDTVNNCSRGSSNLPPVTDLDTGLVYKNEYCAVCHEVSNFRQWGYTFECSLLLYELAAQPNFQLTLDLVGSYCLACGFRDPHASNSSIPAARPCLHHSLLHDYCLTREDLQTNTISEELYQEIATQCKQGPVAPVHVAGDQPEFPFRNQYCALCNGISFASQELTCTNPYDTRDTTNYCRLEAFAIEPPVSETLNPITTDTPTTQPPTTTSPPTTATTPTSPITPETRVIPIINESLPLRPLPRPPPNITVDERVFLDIIAPTEDVVILPFTVIVDVDRNTQTLRTVTRTFTTTTSCDDGELFDVISKNCRQALCPEVARGELCKQVQDIMRIGSVNNTNDTLNTSFPCDPSQLTFLDESEFSLLDNTTLQYGEEVFEILGYLNDSAVICTNFSQNGTVDRNVTFFLYSYPQAFSILTYVGTSMSVVGCVFVLLTYSLFRELRTLPGKILMNLSAAILATSIFILIGIPLFALSERDEVCQMTAIFLHWVVLSQFSWMTIMSYELARTMIRATHLRQSETKKVKRNTFLVYLLIGWGLPIIVTSVSIALNYTTDYIDYGVDGFCWIADTPSFYAVFLVPISLSLLTNMVMFAVTSYLLFGAQRGEAKLQKQKSTSYMYLRIYLSVFSISGLTWLFGFVAILARDDWAWYLFIIFNSSQGFTICVAFLFTRKVFSFYKKLFWPKIAKLSLRSSSSTVKQSTQDTSVAVRYVKKGEPLSTESTVSAKETEFGPSVAPSERQDHPNETPVHYTKRIDEESQTQ